MSRGSLGIWLPGPGLLVAQMVDYGDEAFATPIAQAFDRALESAGPVRMFFDVGRMHNYDSALRTRLTKRFLGDRARIGGIDIFVQSRIVAMGVAVANLALGGIIAAHPKRLAFNLALDDVLRKAGIASFSSGVLLAA